MVAEARDDPAGRIRLAADTYAFGRGVGGIGPTGGRSSRSCVGSSPGCPQSAGRRYPGSRWWRAVNEDLRASRWYVPWCATGERSSPECASRHAAALGRSSCTSVVRQENRMRATRIMANLRVADVEAAKSFYTDYLGLSTEAFNMGWVARYTSPDTGANVQLVTRDATAPEDSVISVATDDVEGAYEGSSETRLRDRAPANHRAMGCAPVLRPSTRRQRNQHREPSRLNQRRSLRLACDSGRPATVIHVTVGGRHQARSRTLKTHLPAAGGVTQVSAVQEMKVWPFGVALRGEAPNRPMLRWLKTVVVSDEEKAHVEASGGDQEDGAQRTAVDVSKL